MNMKVSNKNDNITNKKQGPNNARYKTVMCKHYNTPQGCSYGEKCQFAHGTQELKTFEGNKINQNLMLMNGKQKDALNFKIVKCKNWEKDKTCKYGAHCTFAHGDNELRNKADNLYQMQSSMGMMMQPVMLDMNTMMQMNLMNPQFQGIDIPQMGMGMVPVDPSQMMSMGMGTPINNNSQNPQQASEDQSQGEKKE